MTTPIYQNYPRKADQNQIEKCFAFERLIRPFENWILVVFSRKNSDLLHFFENSVRPYDRPRTKKSPKNGPILMVFTRCRVSSSPHSRVPVRSIYHIRGGCVVIRGSSFVKFVVRVRSFFTELPAGSSVWSGRHVGAFRPPPPPSCG